MALDRLTIQMFKTLEAANGVKSIIKMAKSAATNAPADPEAALALAKLAREYMWVVNHAVVVLDEGEILDEARMERFVRERKAREKAQQEAEPKHPESSASKQQAIPLKETEWQRRKEEINRRLAQPREEPQPKGPRPQRKVDGKVWVTLLDGQRFRVDPDMAALLRGTGKVTLDG